MTPVDVLHLKRNNRNRKQCARKKDYDKRIIIIELNDTLYRKQNESSLCHY